MTTHTVDSCLQLLTNRNNSIKYAPNICFYFGSIHSGSLQKRLAIGISTNKDTSHNELRPDLYRYSLKQAWRPGSNVQQKKLEMP